MDLVIAALVLGGMAVAGFEIWLAEQKHPRRFRYAWAAWTALALLGVVGVAFSGGGAIEGALLAALLTPLAYPIVRGLVWLRFQQFHLADRQAEEAALEAERLRYRPMDFGGVRSETSPKSAPLPAVTASAPTTPVALPAGLSRLDRATRERRSAWTRRAEILLILGVCAVGLALFAGLAFTRAAGGEPSGDEEAIAATLELNGYGAPRIDATSGTCADHRSAEYRWSAIGAAGRACVGPASRQVGIWVEQEWRRPARQPPAT